MSGTLIRFTPEPIDITPLLEEVRQDRHGAIVSFLGVVRDHSRGRGVRRLEYEAYPEMAERVMGGIFHEARERFGVDHVRVVHRTGLVEIGEASIAIVVASPHRAEAFDACRFFIDRIKQSVPIWKKEHYQDGEAWIGDRS